MVTEIVSFPTTNFYGATAPTEAELQDYFAKHEADYRLPDRVQINYITLDPSNYTAKPTKYSAPMWTIRSIPSITSKARMLSKTSPASL